MASPQAARWLRAGRVGRAHGLDGSFHVLEPAPALLVLGARVSVDGRELKIIRRAGDDRRVIIRLKGFADRDATESLRGRQLLAPRTQAPRLDEDEWWADDLEGCEVRDGDRRVGTVQRLLALPSVDVLEVARDEGGAELLVPLVADAVRSVDIEHKQIDVDLRFLGAE